MLRDRVRVTVCGDTVYTGVCDFDALELHDFVREGELDEQPPFHGAGPHNSLLPLKSNTSKYSGNVGTVPVSKLLLRFNTLHTCDISVDQTSVHVTRSSSTTTTSQ